MKFNRFYRQNQGELVNLLTEPVIFQVIISSRAYRRLNLCGIPGGFSTLNSKNLLEIILSGYDIIRYCYV